MQGVMPSLLLICQGEKVWDQKGWVYYINSIVNGFTYVLNGEDADMDQEVWDTIGTGASSNQMHEVL